MNALVTAIADLVKTFCSGVVSLVTVPAQTLQDSFGSAVYALPLVLLVLFIVLKKRKDLKVKGMPRLLNNNKKEDEV
jgi:F0F1-type ATP synthase assembly protein I|nr:MAG TPA: hypothetical protein [Inoviridae sp.]